MIIKRCLKCNKQYETWNKKSKYCSTKCFQESPKSFSHMTLTQKQLYNMYFKKKLSFYKIEDKTNIPVNSIRYWFKKWGFKARTLKEAQSGKLNHGYKDGINSNIYRAYLRDNKECVICGYYRIINIHHIKPKSELLKDLVTLCPNCHSLVHQNIIKIIDHNKFADFGGKHNKYIKNE